MSEESKYVELLLWVIEQSNLTAKDLLRSLEFYIMIDKIKEEKNNDKPQTSEYAIESKNNEI